MPKIKAQAKCRTQAEQNEKINSKTFAEYRNIEERDSQKYGHKKWLQPKKNFLIAKPKSAIIGSHKCPAGHQTEDNGLKAQTRANGSLASPRRSSNANENEWHPRPKYSACTGENIEPAQRHGQINPESLGHPYSEFRGQNAPFCPHSSQTGSQDQPDAFRPRKILVWPKWRSEILKSGILAHAGNFHWKNWLTRAFPAQISQSIFESPEAEFRSQKVPFRADLELTHILSQLQLSEAEKCQSSSNGSPKIAAWYFDTSTEIKREKSAA